ncbi:MAG TPA: SIS domain-containing protein [Actinomycetota bacterium]|nr:SIS domain-containing protein [Actinomycetota bacterium]
MPQTVQGRWLAEARRLLDRIEESQLQPIARASELCAEAIAAGGLVHLFGTGHSRIPLEEMFPRYGSYPGFHPIAELSMTFHTQVVGANGQRQAMFIERVEGLAEQILANFEFGPHDVMMVFSANGLSTVPVEVAMGARKRGLPVVAVTSVAQSLAGRPLHPSGTRLLDHADVVIDLCTPPGDALVTLEGTEVTLGPGSTVAYAAVVNELKVQTAALLVARGALPPVVTSPALVGEERAAALFEAAYRDHARRYARVLAGADRPDRAGEEGGRTTRGGKERP